ncbi:MAG: C2H2-type zinc finger protein [Candidatus Endonucleobacter bathymodioli]|uniref:C2H2-type zinc finger protein n=1 Tax=Candidatus Endonucleibacter bathymodioli TaxID=539814 RepID=A0AA90NKH4_9GAMM|nr:C2H2-type zinc finger protein [Candidatus Endonucleobacter bathymodioli]
MILRIFCIARSIYILNISAVIIGILFSCCLLISISISIKASLDNDILDGIILDNEEEKWVFKFIPPNCVLPDHGENICYISMLDKKIISSKSITQKIDTILISILENSNVEELPNANDYPSLPFCSMASLSGVDADNFLRALNSEPKNYKYAFVVIFTLNKDNKTLDYTIEQIELNNTVHVNGLISNNGSSNELNILKPLFASCKHMRVSSENSYHTNDACCDEISYHNPLFDDIDSMIYDELWLNISKELFPSSQNMESSSGSSSQVNNICYNKMSDINLMLVDDKMLSNDCLIDTGLLNKDKDKDKDIELISDRKKSPELRNKTENSSCDIVIYVGTNKLSSPNSEGGNLLYGHVNNMPIPVSDGAEECFLGKNYECHICSMYFNIEHHLQSHIKNIHQDKKMICSECGRLFVRKYHLKRHMDIHANVKIYKCTWEGCNNTFRQQQHLKTHIRIHTNEKPYPCLECNMRFITKQELTVHTLWHRGETPFKCIICDKAFNRKSVLVRHLKIHTEKNRL